MRGKEMILSFKQQKSERGSVLIVALFILVILTLLGIMATTTTETEIHIAGNEKFHKIAFQNADSGVYSSPKVISAAFDAGAAPTWAGVTYLAPANTFYREIMGFDPHDAAPDIAFILGGYDITVDVNRVGQEIIPGGSAEFGSGAEGVGSGSSGGVGILYDIDSLGEGPSAALSNVDAMYRKVIGTAGGL
jgi:Tfp pilus assembly protein PilX